MIKFLFGPSRAMAELKQAVGKIAVSDLPVLIEGETGTGKSLLAEEIHRLSPRSRAAFVKLDCTVLPASLVESELFGHEKGAFTGAADSRPGIFERASGGTLFLEEVENFEPFLQAKLLTVIEEKRLRRIGAAREIAVDFRLLSASNDSIEDRVEAGNFRRDLFYRLRGTRLYLPPLRERKEDIIALAAYFLRKYNGTHKSRKRLAKEVEPYLLAYSWGGNVRELRYAIEEAAVKSTSGNIRVRDFSRDFQAALSKAGDHKNHKTLVEEEKRHLEVVLNSVHFNKTRAAKILGISLNTLYRKIDKYNLK